MKRMLFALAAITVASSLSCGDSTGPGSGSRPIVFGSRNPQGIWDIFAINPDGTGLRNLTRSAVEDVYPSWNEARTRIAFRSMKPPGGVFVMNADGSAMRHVYSGARVVDHLSWSPDGRHLAIEGGWEGTGRQIRRLDLASGLSRVLNEYGASPDWSPDGLSIAFHEYVNSSVGNHVFVMNASDGSNVRNLTVGRGGLDPSWSPDGRRIAYSSGPAPLKIWVMNADGSNPVQLSSGGDDRLPAWSSDGTQIAFQRNSGYEITTIWVINADGTGERDLTPTMRISGHPSW